MIQKIDYHELASLNFQRLESQDNVFFKKNGYDYFITYLYLKKQNYMFDWDSETHEVELMKLDKERNILLSKKMKDLEEIKFYIELLK